MTITRWDGFAFVPKRCDICNRLFWLEPYDYFTREVGIEYYPLRFYICKECKNQTQVTSISDILIKGDFKGKC